MAKAYFTASINNSTIYVETVIDYIPKLFDHFHDNGYKVRELDEMEYYNKLRDGSIVYHANTKEIVDTFIENSNKIKEIKYGG